MMKNADMPAMPMPPSADGGQLTAQDLGGGYAEQCRPAFGLTKREDFAKSAMQGLLSSISLSQIHNITTCDIEVITKLSLLMADSALDELETQKN